MDRSIADTNQPIIYSLNHYCRMMVATPSYDFLQLGVNWNDKG